MLYTQYIHSLLRLFSKNYY